jgi:hypothetical protein
MTDTLHSISPVNHMAIGDDSPRAIIGRTLSHNPDAIVNASIELLELFAFGLRGIIGDEGFDSLLFRSVDRVTLDYPWLQLEPRALPSDPGFELLRRCFESQDIVQAGLASNLLFNTFIDILTLLIGEHLTTLILQSTLGRVGGGKISKEHHNG